MARRQTVIWTALPNGVTGSGEGSKLRLAVLVTPRLWSDEGARPTLETFPDFLDWPAVDIQFSVQFGNGPRIPAASVGQRPSSRLWSGLFNDNTFIEKVKENTNEANPKQISTFFSPRRFAS